jgi:hypothetical protein
MRMRIVTYLIEYPGEFGFIFETILDYESGDQMGSFDTKKLPSKISCLGTFQRPFCKPKRKYQKQRIPFVCCKWKTETANLHLFAANGNGTLFFLVSNCVTMVETTKKR